MKRLMVLNFAAMILLGLFSYGEYRVIGGLHQRINNLTEQLADELVGHVIDQQQFQHCKTQYDAIVELVSHSSPGITLTLVPALPPGVEPPAAVQVLPPYIRVVGTDIKFPITCE